MSFFGTPDRLAVFVGLAPAPRDSGRISGNRHRPERYHRGLNRVFYYSAMISIAICPESRCFYDRKRAEANAIPRPSWPWPAAASTCCRRCSATTGPTRPPRRSAQPPDPVTADHPYGLTKSLGSLRDAHQPIGLRLICHTYQDQPAVTVGHRRHALDPDSGCTPACIPASGLLAGAGPRAPAPAPA
jgi:hypothetical protein